MGLTRALAFEGAKHGISANAILPNAKTTISAEHPIPGKSERVGRLQEALSEDPDIECVVLFSLPGSTTVQRLNTGVGIGARGFPDTVAELSAFDCIILSGVSNQAFLSEP